MKIILSRKGFDASNGGYPSPIFPDGRFFSLPIPARRAPSRFCDLVYDEHSIGDIVASLSNRRIDPTSPIHLDPDLHGNVLDRLSGWRPAFGQTGSAQSHLASNAVGDEDLFLFFGWFKAVINSPAGWRYAPSAPDLHVIFGWLQVEEVLKVGADTHKFAESYPWLSRHPHLHGERSSTNTIYLASEALALAGTNTPLPGGGIFRRIRPELILTAESQSRRSLWALPEFFLPKERTPLSYHKDPGRWSSTGNGKVLLQSVAKGQEFVLDTAQYPEAVRWANALINEEEV